MDNYQTEKPGCMVSTAQGNERVPFPSPHIKAYVSLGEREDRGCTQPPTWKRKRQRSKRKMGSGRGRPQRQHVQFGAWGADETKESQTSALAHAMQ